MKKYTFLVYHKEYEAFLTSLREAGVVHISEKGNVNNDSNLQLLMAQRSKILNMISRGESEELMAERNEVVKRRDVTHRQLEDLLPWGDFRMKDIEKLQKAGYKMHFYTCPTKKFDESWGVQIGSDKRDTYFVTVDTLTAGETASAELQKFSKEVEITRTPAELRQELEQLTIQLADINERVKEWAKEAVPQMKEELHDIDQKIDWQRVLLSTDNVADDKIRIVVGYCPVGNCEALNAMLDEQHICYQAIDPVPGDNAPAKLVNNRFAKLFEGLTGMYGWPTYGESDPTPFIAPFFLLFFAMCMGDAGYGLILIIFGWLTHKGKVNVSMFEGLGPVITVLGAGTVVAGLILGTFFGLSLYDQPWYPEPMKQIIVHGQVMGYDAQMALAIFVGIFHLCFAMIVKAVCWTMRFGWKETISVWSWTLLVVGAVVTLTLATLLSFSEDVTRIILISIGAVSAVGIYLLNKPGRNPLINIGVGLYETYNMASGLMGDVLSYMRLYALGLAGSALGSTFNDLSGMLLDIHVLAFPLFLLVLLFGHVLNILMSVLGAFVHPLRLTFVEYFKNAGYEGKGVKYKPFKQ